MLGIDFGDSFGAFLGEGSKTGGDEGLTWTPECTRPLNMKTSDNKAIGGPSIFPLGNPFQTKYAKHSEASSLAPK